LSRLHNRDERNKLLPQDFWIIDKKLAQGVDNMNFQKLTSLVSWTLLENCPQVYAFEIRAKIFQNLMFSIKNNEQDYFNAGSHIQVRRDYVVEDAFHAIIIGNKNPKSVFRIQFVDADGEHEAGIDGGGLFKEFMTLVTKKIFDPQYTFFLETEKDRTLYPNPVSSQIPDFARYFRLFGILVGKAIYEGVLLKCTFAKFFLNHFVKKSNQVDDLQALDPQLYENLLMVKYYDQSDVEDLCLTMSINEDNFGVARHIPLVPMGEETPVTNDNRQIYIAKYANYILNQRTREQTNAFVTGLRSVLPDASLDLFFPDEIQKLISGGLNEISVEDLMQNTRFHNYKVDERCLRSFSMDGCPEDKYEDTLYILEFF